MNRLIIVRAWFDTYVSFSLSVITINLYSKNEAHKSIHDLTVHEIEAIGKGEFPVSVISQSFDGVQNANMHSIIFFVSEDEDERLDFMIDALKTTISAELAMIYESILDPNAFLGMLYANVEDNNDE